jgi:hypothetical protein
VKHEHAAFRVVYFLRLYFQAQAINKAADGSLRLGECIRSDYAAWAFISHAKNHFAAAFIREGSAVLEQFIELVTVLGLFELEMLALGLPQPIVKFVNGSGHAISSARLSNSCSL